MILLSLLRGYAVYIKDMSWRSEYELPAVDSKKTFWKAIIFFEGITDSFENWLVESRYE